jgi:glycosyltransferase involved in cell wall biosynthesis
MLQYSVVIPAYNAQRTLRETLASVLHQTIPPAEIIVVDDGSTDETAAIAPTLSPLIRVIHQANSGPGAATTRGVRDTKAPWIAMSDADDLWLPHKMERQWEFLVAHPAVTLASAKMRQFRHGEIDDGTGEVRGGPTRSTIVVRRDVFLDVGDVVDPPGRSGEMVDWLARFRHQGHVMRELDEVLALRRVIAGSLSQRTSAKAGQGFLAVAHAALQRQRAASASRASSPTVPNSSAG